MRIKLSKQILAVVVFGLVAVSESSFAMNQCQRIFRSGAPTFTDRLMSYYKRETSALTPREIKKLNRISLDELSSVVPTSVAGRAAAVPYSAVWKVLELIKEHDIVSPKNKSAYEPEDLDIGYCFGRATFAHLLFLKMGLQEESIRKIWAVGDIKLPGQEKSWAFHVATAVYTREKGWVTIDTGEFKPEELRHWMSAYQGHSTDGRLRFYATEASKLSLDLGPYSRLQLGLDLKRDQDWYRGYFVDLMKSIREFSLNDAGLPRLAPEVAGPRPSVKASSLKPLGETITGDESTFFYMKRLFGF